MLELVNPNEDNLGDPIYLVFWRKWRLTNLVEKNQLARLEATLAQNPDPPTDRLTGVKCRATGVAKNLTFANFLRSSL